MENHLLEQLYRRYAKELYLYIYSFFRDVGIAEDIMHEVFIKAMLSLDDRHSNFKAWLYKVAKNTVLNKIRHEKRLLITEDIPMSAEVDVLTELLKAERDQALYQGMLSLPDKYRQVLILQFIVEMSQAQIAEVLKTSPGNVRVLSHRAKKELRKIMEVKGEL